MTKIKRDPFTASSKKYDLIIVGGGIYGIMLSFISAQKGIKSLLVERDDFGGATSYNSLRIIHGGLRYLQKLDVHRFLESVSERRWFLKNFLGLVEPIPCLMPLYGRGLHRNSIFRIALLLNDLFSFNRNKGVSNGNKIHSGSIISGKKVKEIFPLADEKGLQGGAVWFDGSMPDSQILLKEILKKAVSLGSEALNYIEAKELILENANVKGILANDKISGQPVRFLSDVIINSAGPWCRKIAQEFDADYPLLFKSSIAWNVLFNREALSDHALAITPNRAGAQTFFLRPWKGILFAGTIHEPWDKVEKNPMPSESSVQNFINDLNTSVPDLHLKQNDILHIYSGLLPAKNQGGSKLAVREIILDHSKNKGPKGLFSVSGVKFTTARLVAEKVINRIFPQFKDKIKEVEFRYDRIPKEELGIFDFNWYPSENNISWKKNLKRIIEEESVIHLDDLIFRRTSLGDNFIRAVKISPSICSLFDWDPYKVESENNRLKNYFNSRLKNSEMIYSTEEKI